MAPIITMALKSIPVSMIIAAVFLAAPPPPYARRGQIYMFKFNFCLLCRASKTGRYVLVCFWACLTETIWLMRHAMSIEVTVESAVLDPSSVYSYLQVV